MYLIQRSVIGISISATLVAFGLLSAVWPAQNGVAKSNNLPRAAITATRPAATATKRASGIATPPLLRSTRYLNDISFISEKPCGPPCFRGITVGKTTLIDAVSILKRDKLFKDIQIQEKPPIAAWAAANGEACCQLTANETGVVNVIILKLAPRVTVGQVVSKYGPPQYVSTLDYTEHEVAIGLVYPDKQIIAWAMPGNPQSSLNPGDPIVILLYLNPPTFEAALSVARLQGWNGYLPYQQYRNATPVLTPRVTPTPY